MKSRLVFIFIVLLGLWGVLLFRGVALQIFGNEKLETLKARQFSKQIKLPSRRGTIYDRHGKTLALSMTTYSLFADPLLINKPRNVAWRLKKLLKLPLRQTKKKLTRKGRFVWLKRGLSKEQRDQILSWKVRGLSFIEEARRVYPNGALASQVIGFVGRDGKGLEGIEKRYDSLLADKEKKVHVRRDARGRPLIATVDWFEDQVDGKDIFLTLDSDLQFFIEKELQGAVERFSADSAVALVLDVENSEVLAMAGYPTFSAEDRRRKGWSKWSKNRVLTDAFEPGSTMKTILMAAALKNDVVTPNKKYYCEDGQFKIGKRIIREADSRHHFEWLTVSDILSKSSNIGTSKVAFDLGDKKYFKTLREFGFGEKTGIDFPGESKGIVNTLPWSPHLLANISFGHGVSSTPLQMASAYAAIARGGVWKTPVLIKEVKDSLGQEVEKEQSSEIVSRRILSEEVASQLTMMLTSATGSEGTGGNARVSGFLVAGKTGTAQKVKPNGRGYMKGAYISSFAGFVPAQDPRFVIYIAVDNPQKTYYGSAVAAPVFSRIASFAVRKKGLEPVLINDENLLVKIDFSARKKETLKNSVHQALSRLNQVPTKKVSSPLTHVPEMKGWSLREVYRHINGKKFDVEVLGKGIVVQTIPTAGKKLAKDKRLKIILSDQN